MLKNSPKTGKTPVILIAENDPATLSRHKKLFETAGYQVITTNSGIDLLRQAYNQNPELIMASGMLNDIRGYEVCRIVKHDDSVSSIPVILITEKNSELYKLETCADHCIPSDSDHASIMQIAGELIAGVCPPERKAKKLSDTDILKRVSHVCDQKLQEIDVIQRLTASINNHGAEQETLKNIFHILSGMFHYSVAGIYIINTNEIYIDTCRLLRETYVPSLIKELQDRFGFNTALKKHFVSERKFHADDIFRSETDIIVERLFIHNQESGACVLSRVSGAFSSIEREMFKMVTGALTAVINNIIMYRELERSNRRLNWAKKKLLESNERSDDKEHEHAMKLENLYEAGKMLTTIHEPSRLLATLTYMIINAIDAEVGAAILFDGNTVTEKIEFGLNFSVIKDIRIKQNGKEISLFNYIIETGEMIVLNKEEIKERLILDTLPFIQISTLACVPLQTNLSTSGIMLTVNKLKGKTYTKDDIEALKTLSSMATVAIQNAYLYHQKIEKTKLEADIKMAMEIQKELLPGSPPRNAIFDVASIYTPAEVMGGDYFDYIEVDTNHTGFLVADVTGHGVPAAFIVTLVKSCVQLTAYGKQSPQEVLKALNEFLCRHIPKKNFVSMGYGIIDTVRRTLAYSSAGHNPLLWYSHNTDTFTEIKTDGLFLSLFEDTLFGETTVQLGNNDILVFYTDGLTEAKNKSGEFFGIERIKEIIQKFGHHPAQHIAGLITDSLNEFLDGCALHDDLTSILVKITRSTSFFIPAGN